MLGFLLWCLLFVICWPLALLALIAYPFVWLILLPFRILGVAVHGALALVRAVVMLPARLESARGDNAAAAAAKPATPAAIEVSIIPARIDVTGECEQNMAYEPARRATPVIDRSS